MNQNTDRIEQFRAEVADMLATVPTLMMWDDHDIFDGWGSLMDRTEFDERLYRAAERVFVEYQHLRNPGTTFAAHPPFGYSFWRGDVGFHAVPGDAAAHRAGAGPALPDRSTAGDSGRACPPAPGRRHPTLPDRDPGDPGAGRAHVGRRRPHRGGDPRHPSFADDRTHDAARARRDGA